MKAFDKREDELGWFIGLYEGEGSMYARRVKRKHKDKVYYNAELAITIKMVDEDVIARCANFLGNSYHRVDKKHTTKMGYKDLWRVRKNGGVNGKLRDLLEEMRPYLSQRRREQMDAKIKQAEEYACL